MRQKNDSSVNRKRCRTDRDDKISKGFKIAILNIFKIPRKTWT